MDDLISKVALSVLEYGFPGVVILVLGMVVRALWARGNQMQDQVLELGIKSAAALEANTAALRALTDNLNNK